jgi:Uma2 family endonuclease
MSCRTTWPCGWTTGPSSSRTQVYCGPELDPSILLVENPIIVVEVLSPSTGRNDALGKLEGYFRLASVRHYLRLPGQAARHPPRARGGVDILTRVIRGGEVRLDPPGLTFALADIYER